MDRGSALHAYRPDAVLFALDAHHLLASFDPAEDADAVERKLDRLCAEIAAHWRLAREAFGCKIVQQTALPVSPPCSGTTSIACPARAPGSSVD